MIIVFLIQNFLIIIHFRAEPFNFVSQIKESFTVTNSMDKDVKIYLKPHPSDHDIIYFHGNGAAKYMVESVINAKLGRRNVLFIMNRGYEPGQDNRNKKLMDSDAEAVADFASERMKTQKKLTIIGNSIGTYFGLRCATHLKNKNIPFKIVLINPFFSIRTIAATILQPLGVLISADWSNKKGFEEHANNITVLLSEYENVLPQAEVEKVKAKLEELDINTIQISGNHQQAPLNVNFDMLDL